MLLKALLIVGIIGAFSFLYKVYITGKQNKYNQNLATVVLRVAVSKLNERGPIVAEQIFSALHGIKRNKGSFSFLTGETMPRISVEIANVNNKIQFFIWTPRKFRNVVESQIYAQYPDVEIEEVEDYAKVAFKAFKTQWQREEE